MVIVTFKYHLSDVIIGGGMKRMPYQGNLLSKTLVIGIIILFVGISVVSSIIGIAEDKSSNINFLESTNNPKDTLYCDHSAYILGDGPDCYIYEFILNNASDLNCVCEGSSGYISHATWSSDNYIYFTQYGSGLLYVIEIDTCEMWCIGGGGVSLNGIAYDLTTNRMFGVGEQDFLYEIDPDTGEQELIGKIGGSVFNTVGLAFDSEGILYGWNLGNNKIWKIDKETGEAIIVGDLGFNINYTCDGDFCKKDDILYIAHENKLYMYDFDKGQSELIDEFPDYVSVTALAIPYGNDDTTPPVTTYTLDPPEPDGLNGWYVSDINITLNATDDMSGVKEIHYSINGVWGVIEGSNGTFVVTNDGWDIEIKYWAIDNTGNVEPKNTIMPLINMDKTPPRGSFNYEFGHNSLYGWILILSMNATDHPSGMNRVEFYMDDILQETITGCGPLYEWILDFSNYSRVYGLIFNPEITEEYVRFYAVFVRRWELELINFSHVFCLRAYDNAGNWKFGLIYDYSDWDVGFTQPYIFKSVTLPNNYKGYLGRFFVFATFDTSYQY